MSNCKRSSATACGWFMALLLSALLAGCGSSGSGGTSVGPVGPGATAVPGAAGAPGAAATNPTVGSASPSNSATNVATGTNGTGNVLTGTLLTATFTQAMDPATITALGTFTLKVTNGANVPGAVTMNAANTIATFTPTAALAASTNYTATVSTAAMSALPLHTAIPNAVAWSFTTNAAALTAQAPVNLGLAGNYVIFADTGITNATAGTAITGDMGVGPGVTSTAITGFALSLPAASAFSTSAQVTGKVFAHDYAAPTPTSVTTASHDMGLAYDDAAGRPAGVGAAFLNLGAGTVTTQTLTPGVYTWTSAVNLPVTTVLTLSGGPEDVWIFQIAGTLTVAATARVNLTGGALPKNVFWQVAGSSVTVGAAPAHFEGVVLAKFAINFGSQASANSRLLAQTAVNLDQNAVTQPAP